MKTKVMIAFFLGIASFGLAQDQLNKTAFDHTFTHTVYFWLKNPDSQSDRNLFERSLKSFLDKSKYAKTNFVGTPPSATRDVVDDSFTYALIVTFESAEAQEAYQNEEVHLTFIEECKDLWEKVVVYDALGVDK
ncbi:Dabb family protein [Muricauda sp. JGD-17]|uniref:Dabb family protein n=1 Tax=Flagellimonas ochracea TaxID=2696472 RepID=A0A964WY21_9FLAO|nr:Dabb family protein [Allomuricauda ochracea]NAY92695.1 Dabb family protein [Allomuricauda ochracea]